MSYAKKMISITKFLLPFIAISAPFVVEGIELKSAWLEEISSVDLQAKTQMGDVDATLSVCRLQSKFGWDFTLYVVVSFKEEYPPYIDTVLKSAHSPIMERKGNIINILYTSGANTTCVTTYTVESGIPEMISTKTIAWNDGGGHFKSSEDFDNYSDLWHSRLRHNKSSQATPVIAPR